MDLEKELPRETKYLKASNLDGHEPHVVISAVAIEEIGNDRKERKAVCYFQHHTKGLVLNQTNRQILQEAFSSQTDNWIGREVVLYVAQVPYQGRIVPALRVRVPQRQARQPVPRDNGQRDPRLGQTTPMSHPLDYPPPADDENESVPF